jgi:glycosyltransferase involved in cell wall biosynthesis
MKVLVFDQFSDLGGAQTCLLMALRAMRARGWDVTTGLPGHGALSDRMRELGFRIFPISCGPYGLGQKSITDGARFLSQLPRLACEVRRQARSLAPDLIYLNGPRLLPAAALAGLRTPILFHAHSCVVNPVVRSLAGEALRRLRPSLVACCRFVAESWKGFVPSERVSVVFNGVAGPQDAAPTRNCGGPVIGCIGRIAPEKGQLEFVAVARRIHREMPHSRFIVTGAPLFNSDAKRYHRQVLEASHGLPIEFHGWTTNVYSALADLDLLLVPSNSFEATTRVIPEAFAADVPVVAFASGGIPEVVDHGRTGFLAGSVDEMARCAIELLSGDAARRAAITRAASESWQTRFTPECFEPRLLRAVEVAAQFSA